MKKIFSLSALCLLVLTVFLLGGENQRSVQAVIFSAVPEPPNTITYPIELVSKSTSGDLGNNFSSRPYLSADGSFVVFFSSASNLVDDDTNEARDVFVYNRLTQATTRVSVSSSGDQHNGIMVELGASVPISADGRYLVFHSDASNLVDDDTNDWGDVFVHDLITGVTKRVSVSSGGGQADDTSEGGAISANGQYVVFASRANNLVAGDTNGFYTDIFVHNLFTGVTERVSVSSSGEQADNFSSHGCISADGRYVGFQSGASNLVEGDTNGNPDIFIHDRQTAETTRVSVTTAGEQALYGDSEFCALSAEGRYVAFSSTAWNLVSGDWNSVGDIFVHDRQTGETEAISLLYDGTFGAKSSNFPTISADGRFVSFYSYDESIIQGGDNNGRSDVFVRDRLTGTTTLVSIAADGTQGNNHSLWSAISADGSFVAFQSLASTLVSNDTNGMQDIFVAHYGAPICYTLTSDVTPENSGTVEVVTLPNCGSGYSHGTVVTVTAHAEEGYEFTQWSDDASGTNATTTVTMDADKSATANFLELPAPPVLLSPIDEMVTENTRPSFRWTAVTGGSKYNLAIYRVIDASLVSSNNYLASVRCDDNICQVPAPLALAPDEYTWQVRVQFGTDWGLWSQEHTLHILEPLDLPAPILRSPGEDAIVYGGRPTFKWSPVDGANVYDIVVYDSFYNPIDIAVKGLGACDPGPYCEHRLVFDLETAYGDYTWEVRARNNEAPAKESNWSDKRLFSYVQLERTWQISPENEFNTSDSTPTFEWGEITGATMYLFQVRLEDDTLIGNYLVSDTDHCVDGGACTWEFSNPDALQPGITYKWHVRAKNGRNFGRWTAYRTITIMAE